MQYMNSPSRVGLDDVKKWTDKHDMQSIVFGYFSVQYMRGGNRKSVRNIQDDGCLARQQAGTEFDHWRGWRMILEFFQDDHKCRLALCALQKSLLDF